MLEHPSIRRYCSFRAVKMRSVRTISRLDWRKPVYPNDHNEDSDGVKLSEDGMV